jgi:hypothetical protein
MWLDSIDLKLTPQHFVEKICAIESWNSHCALVQLPRLDRRWLRSSKLGTGYNDLITVIFAAIHPSYRISLIYTSPTVIKAVSFCYTIQFYYYKKKKRPKQLLIYITLVRNSCSSCQYVDAGRPWFWQRQREALKMEDL